MAKLNEPISVRTARLNHYILGQNENVSKTNGLSREGLLDALCLLYDECSKDNLKRNDKNIADFVTRYRPVIQETKAIRVSLNDFVIKDLIGKGYFGDVHLVAEKSTDDIYAMKKIRKCALTSSQVREERDIMAFNRSEWITSLQYAFQDAEYLFLVMEYLPGGDLLSLMIRNGAFDEDLTRFYLAELTLALNALHSMGYVHRDVKPENILLDRCGHLKLADFGNAAMLNKDGSVISLSPVGTPDYIAPELLQTLSTFKITKTVHDVTCDYWSMGIIGYELITEVTPFHEENVHETYSKILCHCEDKVQQKLEYPENIEISEHFKDLINGLVTKASKRLTYNKIIKHPFFHGIDWKKLRYQVPPIIPKIVAEDDTSNFEDVDKKRKRSTFAKSSIFPLNRHNDFSGQNLPFLGYSYVHEEKLDHTTSMIEDEGQTSKLRVKIRDLQLTVKEQTEEVKMLQQNLLSAEKRVAQKDSLDKIMLETKTELSNVKEKLKEKTIELAASKTEIKTLKSSLKIEEDQRLKNDNTIAEVLHSTYQKWEKAKKLADQNYEKQLAEKKTDISNLTQKLLINESELSTKSAECKHLQETVENYKEMLKKSKDQMVTDRVEFERNKKDVLEAYDTKVQELKRKLKTEKEQHLKESEELRQLKQELNESIQSTNSITEAKRSSEKNINEMRIRINQQIEENRQLREAKAACQKALGELQCQYDDVTNQVIKMQEQAATKAAVTELVDGSSARSSIVSDRSISPYRSAKTSFQDLPGAVVEEQLRNDLMIAKENENIQRKRADDLEEVIERLENMINRFDRRSNTAGGLLEKQNEKLEDQLVAAREQAIVERQAARTANLGMWKLEKQVEDLTNEKKSMIRRMELHEQKFNKLKEEKMEIDVKQKGTTEILASKDREVWKLQKEIEQLKEAVCKEHSMWQATEQERMKEKSEIIEHISKIHKLEEIIEEGKSKLLSIQKRNDSLLFENKRLNKEIVEERNDRSQINDAAHDAQTELDNLKRNYNMLKEACNITEVQLTELEDMLDAEVKRNKVNQEKIDDLWKKIRAKDEEITKMRQELTQEKLQRAEIENKYQNIEKKLIETKDQLEHVGTNYATKEEQLMNTTSSLFNVQERIELMNLEVSNLQIMKDNYEREIVILKEENTQILTELFLSKEDSTKLSHELKAAQIEIGELKHELDHMNSVLSEQKNYYLQRDIKSEATLAQHKKLIDYLHAKVEELSHKKKITLMDKLFGGSESSSKKENVPPNAMDTIGLRKIQEDLRRERCRNNQLKEQLLKAKTEMRVMKGRSSPIDEIQRVHEEEEIRSDPPREEMKLIRHDPSTTRSQAHQNHRFEMTIESPSKTSRIICCIVCNNPVPLSNTFWRCKECRSCVHRKCRNAVTSSCDGEETIDSECIEIHRAIDSESDIPSLDGVTALASDFTNQDDYKGNSLFRPANLSPPVLVHHMHEMNERTILLGCQTGLYSYHFNTQQLVHISGIESVNFIAITPTLSKLILIGNDGEFLYQVDLRHLENRSQASASLKPKLESTILELPFANRTFSERWHFAKIHGENENLGDAIVIAATQSRIVILKFDMMLLKFKPVRALDTAIAVSNILFTRHTAIVSADKFYEIEMDSFAAEEFLDMSDATLAHTRRFQPIAAFRINKEEFLLCFAEFGIFVDEYGCRSRPDDINWTYTPTGFIYRDPILFISHVNMVQVMRLYRSYSHEMNLKLEENNFATYDVESNVDLKTFISMNNPKLLNDAGKFGVYVQMTHSENDSKEIFVIDGLKALRSKNNGSFESLASSSHFPSTAVSSSSDTISSIAIVGRDTIH